MDHVKRIWYLSPMRAAKVQASLRIRAVSPEPPLLAHTSSESRGTFRQKARSLAPLNDWACAVKICHDGMLEGTNSLDGAQIIILAWVLCLQQYIYTQIYSLYVWETVKTGKQLILLYIPSHLTTTMGSCQKWPKLPRYQNSKALQFLTIQSLDLIIINPYIQCNAGQMRFNKHLFLKILIAVHTK